MKNLRIGIKLGLVIALLVLTALVILWVGYTQQTETARRINHLVDSTIRTQDETHAVREELYSTLRSQRLAVLSDQEKDIKSYAEQTREATRKAEEHRDKLADLIDRGGVSEDRRKLDDFNRHWNEFKDAQNETLDLAEQNTNNKARVLLHGKVAAKMLSIEEVLTAVTQQTERDLADPTTAKELAKVQPLEKKLRSTSRLLAFLDEINLTLAYHIEESGDAMAPLDDKILHLWREADALITGLTASHSDKSQVDRLNRELSELKTLVKQVQDLSHKDTNNKALQITLGRVKKAMDGCVLALDQLTALLDKRTKEQVTANEENTQAAQRNMLIVAFVGIAVSVVLAWFITRSIVQPMAEGVRLSAEMAEGNLKSRLNIQQTDEVGQLAQAIDRVANSLCGIICNIRRVSQGITGSATELSNVSHDLMSQSEEMAAQSTQVAGSTEQMATNINTMAAAAEEVSMNVVSISSASEEISANVGTISTSAETTAKNVNVVVARIQEATNAFDVIAKDAGEGSQVTAKAFQMAQQATGTMSQLDRSASEINKVTEAIKMIALQTNLLALNATIEATAAGEAGKGFAVVAHEIKELANQSGRAAEDIAHKIESVQGSTREAVRVIEQMATIISSINTSAERISAAVLRQTKSANDSVTDLGQASHGVESIAHSIREVAKGATDMSRNASEAAKGANDVSRNASEAAKGVREVSSNIHGVNQATQENATSAQRVNAAADKLKEIAKELEKIIGQFQTKE